MQIMTVEKHANLLTSVTLLMSKGMMFGCVYFLWIKLKVSQVFNTLSILLTYNEVYICLHAMHAILSKTSQFFSILLNSQPKTMTKTKTIRGLSHTH